ncbi:MAG: phosphatase PAP2 family protein [Ignavibacteria bacterium]|nr:phosphatase PAP2 family protein [Ignavibacteria bacterium]
MKKKFLHVLFLILLFFLVSDIYAQYHYSLKRFFEDGISLAEAPGKWDNNDFINLALISGSTYALMYADEPVRGFILSDCKSCIESPVAATLKYWGEPSFNAALSAFFLIQGTLAENSENKELGFLIAQSYLYTGAVTGVLKLSFGRERPKTGGDAFTYHPFSFRNNDYMSFPSGHTSTSFALSTVLASRIDSKFLKVIVYIPALAAGMSRICQNQHWLSDVFFGAFLGYFIGRHLVERSSGWKSKPAESVLPRNVVNVKIQF